MDGGKLGIDKQVYGLELLETDITIGGNTYWAGTVLMSLNDSDSINPTNENLSVERHDIFALEVYATEQDVSADTVAVSAVVLDGSTVGDADCRTFLDGSIDPSETPDCSMIKPIDNARPVPRCKIDRVIVIGQR